MQFKILFGAVALLFGTSFFGIQSQARLAYGTEDYVPSSPNSIHGKKCSTIFIQNGTYRCSSTANGDNCVCENKSSSDVTQGNLPDGYDCWTGGSVTTNSPGHSVDGQCIAGELPAAETAASTDTTPATENPTCSAEAELQACQAASTLAVETCDISADTGVNNAVSAANQASQAIGTLQPTLQSMNIIQACSKIGDVSTAANAAVFAFQANCKTKQSSCFSTCQAAKAKAETCLGPNATTDMKIPAGHSATTALQRCEQQNNQLQTADQSLRSLVQTGNQSVQCAQMAGNDFCSKFPGNAACQTQLAQNCSNPSYALANAACACLNNKQSEACIGAQKAGGGIGVGNDLAGAGKGLSGQGDPGGGVPMPPPDQVEKLNFGDGQKKAGNSSDSGGGGGSGGGPSKQSSINQMDKGGRPGSGERQSILPGFMGQGNGGGLNGFVGAVKSAVNNFMGNNNNVNAKLQAERDLLKSFLPKAGQGIIMPGDRKAVGGRQIASETGISGPNSDLWINVKNRYRVEASKLLP